ncbi:hypothetical protein WJX72_008039 [[Myrmecia] bisecta]|uniref:F-box domain-containing protein n=1 Tax=[Myrmecia] bisecta TaxID=41462 RepID=A0AAW1R8E5_9CHLO
MDCEPTAVEEEATCGFHSLPDDVVATVLCCLEAHDVASSQAACQRVRDVVVRHEIWKRLCLLKAPSLSLISQLSVEGCAFPAVSHLRTAGTEYQRSFLYQALWHRLSATPAQESLIADVLSVSSVDNPEEGGQNVLRPEPRNTRNWAVCYWSSKGSDDEESAETMTLQLAHPLCLVNEIRIRPFKAYFQPGQPIYAAKAAGAGREWLWTSDAFPMEHSDHLQSFPIPATLCVGGHLKIEFLGRVQKQDVDDRWELELLTHRSGNDTGTI